MGSININSVYIIGLGALGSMYAAKLQDAQPGMVKIIANAERISALKNSEITVNDKVYRFDFIIPGEIIEPADLLIVAVKSSHLPTAVEEMKSLIGPDTIVMSLLNGISSEELIAEEVGMEHVIYSFAVGMDAVRIGTQTRYTNPGKIVFGEERNDVLTERIKAIEQLFVKAGIPYQIPVDMQKALWSKFMMNTGINQTSAVLRAPYGIFQQDSEARKLMLIAAREVFMLSQLCGINLTEDDVNNFLQILDGLDPAGKTSMLQDVEAGRKTEVDFFAGTVVALGKKYNVETPVNQTLYYIIKSMENAG